MKRVLLSCFLIACVLAGKAQTNLWFNEIVPSPGNGNQEYIEFFNTSTSDINLDCYFVVSYNSSGVYVYNFPSNSTIKGLSYFLLSSNYTVNFKAADANGKASYTFTSNDPNFSNWNDIGSGGYISKYSYNTITGKWGTATSVVNNFNDFIDNNVTSLLLYRINSDGTTSLVNGLFGNSIPSGLALLNDLTGVPTSGTCSPGFSTVSFKFKNVKSNQVDIYQNQSSSGNQNGYAKIGNGVCGNWAKTQNKGEFTPSKPNPTVINNTTTGGIISSTQKIICGTRIDFTLTSATDPSYLPVTVLLYIDNNKDGILDGNDSYVQTYPNTISNSNTVYSFTGLTPLPSTKQYLLVYKTNLGCFGNVIAPTDATGAITTTQSIICSRQVDFAVTGVSGDAASYGLPVTVQLYDAVTNLPIESPVSVTASDINKVKSIPISADNQGKSYILVYKSANDCYTVQVSPKEAQISLTTTQKNICGNYVDVTVSAATLTGSTLDPTNYVVPMVAELHLDANKDNVYDPGNPAEAEVLGIANIASLSAASYAIAIPTAHKNDNIIVVYKTAQDCFSKTALPSSISGTLTTTQTNTCNKRIDFSITGGTGDALTYALPITVELRNAADNSLLNSTTVSSFSSNVLSLSVPDPSQSVVLVYKPAASCLSSITATPAATAAALQIGGNIPFADVNANGTRTVTYFVVNPATNAAAFPLDLKLYEDVNKDGVINSDDKLVGQQTINSVSQSQIFSADITNPNSLAIVTAASVPSGCATATLPLSNTNAPVTILPVHFATFSAIRNNNSKSAVNLKWSTATEQNNRGFNVQRNTGSGWKTIAFVFSLADGGNSNTLLSYEYKDANSEKGITQYRIQQVDMDGKASFSDTRSVMGIEKAAKMIVYPNPSNDGKVNVGFENPSVRTVLVSDVAGRIVKEYNNVTGNTLEIAPLAPGFYSIRVTDLKSGVIAVEKVIIK